MNDVKMKYALILILNLLYCTVLLNYPGSRYYHVWEKDVIELYSVSTSPDTSTYANPPEKDSLRTVGYPCLLKIIMQFDNWIFILLTFNCLIGTWFFYVVFQLIGPKAWILAFLGMFTLYTSMILTDLLFATIFVTAIWQVKRLWLHFLLIGLASLIRPSLAWFFLIEPIVLYFNGYKGMILFYSLLIVFAVTAFSPIRNLINTGHWTHSTVMQYNLDNLYTGPKYFVTAFFDNYITGHASYLLKRYALPFNLVLLIINALIWLRFAIRVIHGKINWGYVLILAYFVGPTLFGSAGPRIRLPIEWILLI